MRKITVSILSFGTILGLLALSGCNNLASPESTVASAYSDIQNGNLGDFQATLSGQALSQYGTQAGLTELQSKLAQTDPRVGNVQKLSEGPNNDGNGSTAIYDVTVVNKSSATLMDLTVICDTNDVGDPACIPNNPGPNPPGCPILGQGNEATFCAIDSITGL